MINYKWSIIEVFTQNGNVSKVRYFVRAEDESNFVETEGEHIYKESTVVSNYEEIKEEDLIRWVIQDTTKDDVNIIKSNLEHQLASINNSKKVELPWLLNTFTIE